MHTLDLSVWRLAMAASLVLALALTLRVAQLGMARELTIAAVRTLVQLLLVGLVLKAVFALGTLPWVALMALVMLLMAGHEVSARQQRRLRGGWSYGIGAGAMFVSAFATTLLTLAVVVRPEPWFAPRYAIPLLGMLLGNTMTGVALGLDRLTETAWQQRAVIEARLMLGQPWHEAIGEVRRVAVRSGLIPIVNGMAAAGVVSLPGMMTGQILAGSPPTLAVKYQLLVMFTIAAATGFGTLAAVHVGGRRLFDERERLRLDRLTGP